MLAIALGLGASICWGAADFLGGVQSRRLPTLKVVLVSQAVGLAGAVVLLLASGDSVPSSDVLLAAVVAGITGITALCALFRALAIGTMSIVAPISATGQAIPVVAGLIEGERPGALQFVGIAVALIGVAFASRERDESAHGRQQTRQSVLLALVAAVGFGSFYVAMDYAADVSVTWGLSVARLAAVGLLLVAALALRQLPRSGDRVLPLVWLGLLDLLANCLFAVATTEGLLSIVAVLTALYPVTTVLLAMTVLHERLQRIQSIGVVATLIGVALIAIG